MSNRRWNPIVQCVCLPCCDRAVALAALLLLSATSARAADGFAVAHREGSLEIRYGGERVARYLWNDPTITRPYFCDVCAPGDFQITRHHPPREGTDLTDHATFHPGMWLAFGDLAGGDFWRLTAPVRHAGFDEPADATSEHVRFAVKNEYVVGDRVACDELCRVEIRRVSAGYLWLWDSIFAAREEGIYFGDQEEMGLGIRLDTRLIVQRGGTITNSRGDLNEGEAWGKSADWCDYHGVRDTMISGVLLMPHPENFRKSWFHVRDYGLLVANPFGRQALTGGEPSRIELSPTKPLRLRFGVLFYRVARLEPSAEWTAYRKASP